MQTATLTLTYNGNGEVNVNVQYDPPLADGEVAILATLMNAAVQSIYDLAPDGDEK